MNTKNDPGKRSTQYHSMRFPRENTDKLHTLLFIILLLIKTITKFSNVIGYQ